MSDTHGKVIERFSFRHNAALRELNNNDIMFVLGDFGQPFGPITYKEAEYTFKFLDEKPWTTIVIGGNHDDYDYWQSCPQVKLFGGIARQATFNDRWYSVFFIDEITILDISNQHILCIPGAESHDADILLDPNEVGFKRKQSILRKHNQWFRVIGRSWWPQEKMDVPKNAEFMEYHMNEHFDYIFTHDAPALINQWFKRPDEPARRKLDFDAWIHSHFHFDYTWNKLYDDRMHCVYYDILQLAEENSLTIV